MKTRIIALVLLITAVAIAAVDGYSTIRQATWSSDVQSMAAEALNRGNIITVGSASATAYWGLPPNSKTAVGDRVIDGNGVQLVRIDEMLPPLDGSKFVACSANLFYASNGSTMACSAMTDAIHGPRGGGTQHSLANASDAGFLGPLGPIANRYLKTDGAGNQTMAQVQYGDLGGVPTTFAPTEHAYSHLPNTGSDALATAIPAALAVGQTTNLGTANSFSRSDHQHAMPGLANSTNAGFVTSLGTTANRFLTTDGAGNQSMSQVPWASGISGIPSPLTSPSSIITGSGTAGYLPAFTGTNGIGNSIVYQTSGNNGFSIASAANFGNGFSAAGGLRHFYVGSCQFNSTNFFCQNVGSNAFAMISSKTDGIHFSFLPSTGASDRVVTTAEADSGDKIVLSNTGAVVTGKVSATGEVIADGGIVRIPGGNYGSLWYNNGSDLYLLMTDSGSKYGSSNSLRPFTANLGTGNVAIGGYPGTAQLSVGGTLYSLGRITGGEGMDITGAAVLRDGATVTNGLIASGTIRLNTGSPAAGQVATAIDASGTVAWKNRGEDWVDSGGLRYWDSSVKWATVGPLNGGSGSSVYVDCNIWSGCLTTYNASIFASTEIEVEFTSNAPGSGNTACRQKFYGAAAFASSSTPGWYMNGPTVENTSERSLGCVGSAGQFATAEISIYNYHTIQVAFTWPYTGMVAARVRMLGSGVHS